MNKTKKIIFDAAIRAFSKKGFHKATVDEIAEEAGIAKGTLYYHFKSKEEIFKFVVCEGIKNIINEVKDKTENIDNPIDKLRMVCQTQYQLAYQYQEFFKALLEQVWGDEARQKEIRQGLSKYFQLVTDYLNEAIDQKLIPDCDVEVIAYNFFGNITATVVYNLTHENSYNLELEKTVTDFVIRGIGAK